MAGLGLIVFDCDGVLVDSEPLAMRVLLGGLAEAGYRLDEEEAYERFLGRSLATIQRIIREDLGWRLPEGHDERMRERLFALFRSELQPIPGVEAALDALALPRCVASSSQPDRIRLSLEVTGLLPRLAPHLFSAVEVRHGKPAPDLFLHAAERMGVPPAACVVIEDSPAGIEAARRAGMRVLGFAGASHAQHPAHRGRLLAAAPDEVFDDMQVLPALVARLGASAVPEAQGS